MVQTETRVNLPWVEKYRPSTLDDLVSHEDIIKTVSKFIQEDQVPHLLFYGPPGTGKTSTILACARQLYTPGQFSSMVLELNASDDRGIGIVRGQILTFASTRTIFKSGFKLIILDEADAMTMDAQNALRRKRKRGGVKLPPALIGASILYDDFQGGKPMSSVIRRLCYNEFSRHYTQTVGADFYIKHVVIPGRRDVTLRITDVGGLELNGNMLDKYLFNANIIIMVYDITNSATFDYLSVWIDTMAGVTKCPPIVGVIGNKCDAEFQRAISSHTVNKFVKDCNLLGFTMSAKTGEMVTAGIVDLVSKYLGVPLTKTEKEYQRAIIKAELVPATRGSAKATSTPAQTNSSVCTLQ